MISASAVPAYELHEFQDLITKKPDLLSSHPCVIRGFTEQWPAARRWTDLRELSEQFGALPVTAGAPQFVTHRHSKMCQVRTEFASYLRYVADPSALEEVFQGQWVKGDAATLRDLGLPLYCGNLRLVRHSRETILKDITPLVPDGLECLNDEIPYYYQSGNHVWLYVSITGALTPLHQDNNAVIAYLAQLKGSKEAILYSPEDKQHFHNPRVGYLNPLEPNEEEFPTWRRARAWTASLNAGELLIWGADWAHHVRTLTDSITVSFDVVNSSNLWAYSQSNDWREELGRFCRANAGLVRDRIADPDINNALEDATESDLGRDFMSCVLRSALASTQATRSQHVKSELLRMLSKG